MCVHVRVRTLEERLSEVVVHGINQVDLGREAPRRDDGRQPQRGELLWVVGCREQL